MAIEAVDTRARGLRARGERVSGLAVVQRLDWVLLAALGATVAYGIWAINGITLHDAGGSALTRQIEYAVAGAFIFIVALFIDPDIYRRWRRPIYVGTTGVMLLVLATGAATRGSKRWINVGFFTFQPSEFGKVLFILVIAGVLADRARSMNDPRTPLRAIAFGLVPILLVFVQPDIGTALVYTAGLLAVLFVSGVRWSQLAVLVAVATAAVLAVLWLLPASGINVLKPYQAQRLTGFTHPSSDPRGATYNLRQSITAVGAGGLRGRGIIGATQTRLNYLPEHATDFAFASLAEERGFFGVSILLLLYLLIVWRALKIVAGARDLYCAIVAGGITFMFLFQVFVNSAMTMGIAPITGIPLPFVSVGGSSMITNLLAMGVLQAIHARRGLRRRS
ncbi:MAG TPA: rod shape-determining protein RodA [Gaiellaceae bacterium]|jgi:rod shape determining protein RodA